MSTPKDSVTESLPKVELGDLVQWFPGGNENTVPHVGIVTAIGTQGMLCVNLFNHNSSGVHPRDGVRHISDPRRKQIEFQENGAWAHLPQHTRLLARLLDIEKAIAAKK